MLNKTFKRRIRMMDHVALHMAQFAGHLHVFMHVAQFKRCGSAFDQPQLRVRIITTVLDPLAEIQVAAVHRVSGKLRRAPRQQRPDTGCKFRTRFFVGIKRENPIARRLLSAEFFCRAKPFHGSTNTFAPNDRAMDTVASVLPESTITISLAISFTLFSVRPTFASSLSVMMQTERLMRGRITGAQSAGHAGCHEAACHPSFPPLNSPQHFSKKEFPWRTIHKATHFRLPATPWWRPRRAATRKNEAAPGTPSPVHTGVLCTNMCACA